jgi:hypothetical protein
MLQLLLLIIYNDFKPQVSQNSDYRDVDTSRGSQDIIKDLNYLMLSSNSYNILQPSLHFDLLFDQVKI